MGIPRVRAERPLADDSHHRDAGVSGIDQRTNAITKVKPQHEYRIILRPTVDHLLGSGNVMIDAQKMGDFLGIPRAKVYQLVGTDRIPLPVHLGLGRSPRWSVYELLEWVEAGCPRREEWIEQRGWSGWARRPGHRLLW